MLVTPEYTARAGTDSMIGLVLGGRYRVLSRVGSGAVGAVYEVEHTLRNERLAVKCLACPLDPENRMLRRFEREAKLASLLSHENIVEVLDLGRLDSGTLYIIMELLVGDTIAELVEDGPLGVRRALSLARQVLCGVSLAHGRGLVHRDLKPENIMVVRESCTGRQVAKILDFGLVKLLGAGDPLDGRITASGVAVGTPAYMSPEQVLCRTVDGRTDLYSVGMVLFQMLTGRHPFEGGDHLELLRRQVGEAPPTLAEAAPQMPWWTAKLEHLVARALRKAPELRFATATEMIEALDRAVRSLENLSRSVALRHWQPRQNRRR